MSLSLHNLKSRKRKKRKRVGRGNASGHGTYSGRGLKGQKSRSDGKKGLKLKGFKVIIQNIPKTRGFKSIHPKMEIVNTGDLEKKFKEGDLIDPKKLQEVKLVDKIGRGVKILGQGKITKKLTVKAHKFSKSAESAIKKAGGEVELIK
ncbi:MAG: 50S ribosomal protein L15 [Parcubacteria group bacterium CG23_combo_of_CG06-09_8_20_14_all_35_9]|nr:MAG: 50S ribosomal protein L15 [Parcubacteria group bacterium CG23_combo_of_CG06-09_8_20_14_all_35_9]